MGNMSYCRHENTYNDLADVWEEWVDNDEAKSLDEYEKRARRNIAELVSEMHYQFANDGTYEFYASGEWEEAAADDDDADDDEDEDEDEED